MSQAIITFAGLMVFRRDLLSKTFELGILRSKGAHDHTLQIKITPDGAAPATIDPAILERYVQSGDIRWNLEVEDVHGIKLPPGVLANTGIPADRLHPDALNEEDFGWVINLESGEFHGNKLDRLTDKFKPVIYLKKGKLYTSCKTEAIEVTQGGSTRPGVGFIAGATALAIDTSGGEEPVLNFVKGSVTTEIFRLRRGTSYAVEIVNTPLVGAPHVGGHFHLFYDLLFNKVPPSQRFGIESHTPRIYPDDRCPEQDFFVPDPFKCGGIGVNDGSGPLG